MSPLRTALAALLPLVACEAEPGPRVLTPASLDAAAPLDAAATPADAVPPDAAAAPESDLPPDAADAAVPPPDASAAPDAARPPSATDRLFDDTAPPPLIEIEMAPADWQRLQETAREEQWLPCRVSLGAERFETAACRYKGAYGSLYACFDEDGRRLCPKLSVKVSFNEYDRDGRFQGLRKLVLNACNRDVSCLRERLSYAAFRAAGLPASRAVHVRVRLPETEPGVYLLVENPDRELLEDHFAAPGGNLYKEIWPVSLRPEPYLQALKTNEEEADVSHILQLAWLLSVVTDEDFNRGVDPYIDRDAMARYLVVDQLIHNWDGIWKWYCQGPRCGNHNYFLYDDPSTGRFVVLPWDLDHTWNVPNEDLGRSWFVDVPCPPGETEGTPGQRAPQCDPLLRGLMRLNQDLFREYMRRLVLAPDAPLSEAALLSRLDRWRAQIAGAMAADPLGPGDFDWRRAVASLRQIVRAEVRAVEAFLAAPTD